MRWAQAALVALAIVAAAPSAHAEDPKKEAQGLFTQGVKLTESGDLQGALAAFRAAHDKSPNFRVLYNIGKLCARLQDPACAVKTFEQYLQEGAGDVPPKRRTEVDGELQTAKAASGSLTITVSAPGADVTIDDVGVGRSPLPGAVPVNPGDHKIVATFEGRAADRSLKVSAGDTTTVDLQIAKSAPIPSPIPEKTEDAAPAPAPEHHRSAVPWIVTGSLAGATLITGIIAAVTYSSFTDKRDQFPVTRAELDSSQGTARTFFVMTGVFGALTLVSAGVAGFLTLSTGGPKKPTTGASVAIGPRGISLEGTLP